MDTAVPQCNAQIKQTTAMEVGQLEGETQSIKSLGKIFDFSW